MDLLVSCTRQRLTSRGIVEVQAYSARGLLRGGRSFLDALVDGMRRLVAADPLFDFFVNLGDTDYALQPVSFLTRYLLMHPATSFISSSPKKCECNPLVLECGTRVFGLLRAGAEAQQEQRGHRQLEPHSCGPLHRGGGAP